MTAADRLRRNGPAQVSTLAYVVTRCHEGKAEAGYSGSQALWVRQGDREPVKIVEFVGGQPPIGGFCRLFGNSRIGSTSAIIGAFQRLGVSPDGSTVVFEVTDDFSPFTHVVSPEQQGIFAVHADGSGLHRVADHSNDPAFRIDWRCAFANAPGCAAFLPEPFEFSPNGRRVVYTDLGPSDTGEEASQVFTLDLATGARQQVTHVLRLPECRGQSDDPPDCVQRGSMPIWAITFVDDTTIAYDRARGNGGEDWGVFTVTLNADGTPQGEPQAVQVVSFGEGVVIPIFEITGAEAYAFIAVVPGRTPVNGGSAIAEAFVVELPGATQRPDGRVLQVTNFGRSDTGRAGITTDSQHVLVYASADPLGTNPANQCEWFSVDRLGSDLQQLTSFSAVGERGRNCGDSGAPGCTILGHSRMDLRTDAVVFDSTCDPLGTSPHDGDQIFAMRPDGSGLRQLTDTQGMITHPDHSIDVELPGPFHIPSRLR